MKPYFETTSGHLYQGHCLHALRAIEKQTVYCCVTSPPYWGLRDYGADGQLGLETSPEEYVAKMVWVFREVRRVLRDDGTLWLNLGDSYSAGGLGHGSGKQTTNFGSCNGSHIEKARKAPDGFKRKELIGIPWRVAFALQADGWYLRSDIIWQKPNPMPESVTDRPTKSHEYLFLLAKSERYHYDHNAIKEPHGYNRWTNSRAKDASVLAACYDDQAGKSSVLRGGKIDPFPDGGRNKRSVWTVPTRPFPGAHFATFPPALIEPCLLAGCPEGGTVLDPFFGAGTTGLVAHKLNRRWIGIELSQNYCEMAARRIDTEARQLKLFAPPAAQN